MIGPEPDHGGVRARQRHRLGTIGLTATWRWCNLLVHISPTLAFSFAVMPSCCWRYIAPLGIFLSDSVRDLGIHCTE